MAFVPGNKQKAIDFIVSKNYSSKTTSKEIRDDLHKKLGIDYTVHNINLIRHQIRKGKAKPTNIANLIPPEPTTVTSTPIVTVTENLVPQPEENTATEEQLLAQIIEEQLFAQIIVVRNAASNVGGLDRLVYITQMMKKYNIT